ncbi:MAG TPA: hypothetical protein VFL90_06275 [Methylomirabilota bacterium]|nr:hypothetical protein [Methylomirabilota bacterium]
MLAIGFGVRRRSRDTVDFFLARRSLPWWVASPSTVATEVSAVTLVALTAGTVRRTALLFAAATLARLVVVVLFIPAFYGHDDVTIYGLLGRRFGPLTRATAAGFFLLGGVILAAVRLMVAALLVAMVLGWPLAPVLALFTLVAVLYMATGGVRAVAWANGLQVVVFLGAGVAALAWVVARVDGGLDTVLHAAGETGRLGVVEPAGASAILLLTALFGALAATGTDQDVMQRLIAARSRRQSQVALALAPLGTALTLTIYLGLGCALAAFYAQHPELPAVPADQALSHYVQHALPAALRGLSLAALVLASLDAPLAGLSAAFVSDVYRPLLVRRAGEAHYLTMARLAVVLFGLLLGALAWALWLADGVVPLALRAGGVTAGPLLGVFLLALLARRPLADAAGLGALVTMAAVNGGLLMLAELGRLPFAWSWLVLVGAAGTVALAVALDALRREPAASLPHPADTSGTRTP